MGKNRERFERELARAGSFERFAVVIEAGLHDVKAGRYRSEMKPHAVLQSVTAFYIRYGIPFLFCGDRAGAEYLTYSILEKFAYEIHARLKLLNKIGGMTTTTLNERNHMEANDLTQSEHEHRADVEPDPTNPATCTGCDLLHLRPPGTYAEPNPRGCDGCKCKAKDTADGVSI
jgi:hypothetical protein